MLAWLPEGLTPVDAGVSSLPVTGGTTLYQRLIFYVIEATDNSVIACGQVTPMNTREVVDESDTSSPRESLVRENPVNKKTLLPGCTHSDPLMTEPRLTFLDQNEWEKWLTENGSTSRGIWLRLARKGAVQPTLTYEQALESALCHGWIDGQKRTESEAYWLQRFTRRSAKSIWSRLNKDRAEALIAAGRMLPPGMREIEKAKKDGRWEAAYASASNSVVPEDLQAALDANPKASAFFATLNGRNRYAILFRIQNAKKPATRVRKIEEFIGMLDRGETIHP